MSDPDQIKCPHCGQTYGVQPGQWSLYAGRSINCTRCGNAFLVDATTMTLPPGDGCSFLPQSPGWDPSQPVQTRALAVTSLVSGILGFCIPVVGGLTAIITGILAMRRASRNPRIGGKGLAIAGICVGSANFLFLPMYIAVLLPSLGRAREQANRAACAANMKAIGQGILLYVANNKDQYPDSLETLVLAQQVTPRVLICPSSKDTVAEGQTPNEINANLKTSGHNSYHYLGSGLTKQQVKSDDPILIEPLSNHGRDGSNVLFGDNHVEFIHRAEVQSIMDARGTKRSHRQPTRSIIPAPK